MRYLRWLIVIMGITIVFVAIIDYWHDLFIFIGAMLVYIGTQWSFIHNWRLDRYNTISDSEKLEFGDNKKDEPFTL